MPVKENVALKVGGIAPPTMSVPTRSQSGSSAASRIHSCKSVTPDGNAVPGGTMGLGADSQKKLPALS